MFGVNIAFSLAYNIRILLFANFWNQQNKSGHSFTHVSCVFVLVSFCCLLQMHTFHFYCGVAVLFSFKTVENLRASHLQTATNCMLISDQIIYDRFECNWALGILIYTRIFMYVYDVWGMRRGECHGHEMSMSIRKQCSWYRRLILLRRIYFHSFSYMQHIYSHKLSTHSSSFRLNMERKSLANLIGKSVLYYNIYT